MNKPIVLVDYIKSILKSMQQNSGESQNGIHENQW